VTDKFEHYVEWIHENKQSLGTFKKYLEVLREDVKDEIFIGNSDRDRDMRIKGKVEMLDNLICNL
jgi:hypothetical protein